MQALDHLNEFERNNLLKTHKRHLKSMGKEDQENHKLENITKVERNHKEKCFIVHYDNGEWYHYTLDHEWY